MSRFLIYGANGYTGRLIVREAVAAGLRPVVAGRNRVAVEALAREHDLEARAFDLIDRAALAAALADVPLVLNCAGPFSQTVEAMLGACLATGVHYLDITGEIDVFARCHRADADAKRAGIIVLPGTGFDVVPTDCTAAMLKRRLPDATSLVLAFEAGGGPSPGTAKTSIEGLGRGGRARIGGKLVSVPLAWKTREFVRADGTRRLGMTIPWGDVYTAFVSTGIADVKVYMTVSPATVVKLRRLRAFGPLLRLGFVQRFLQARAGRTSGPSPGRRERTACTIWGEVRNARGDEARLTLTTPNGYDFTAAAATGIVRCVLAGDVEPGYSTPSQLMGADYVLRLPGVGAFG